MSDLEQELTRVKQRLQRARQARLEAEAIAEKATRELFEKERQLQLLQEVAVAANEARAVDEALQFALDRVCAYTGWPVGHAYVLDPHAPQTLIPTRLWFLKNTERFATFRTVTEATPLASGSGLPGRVLADGKPLWVNDVTQDSNFPRAQAASDIGVRAGFGFPVLIGAEVVAVLEFFAESIQEPDDRLLHAMAHIGTQIGRVVERKREEITRQFSTPVLQVRERLLILPVIGVIDSQRARQLSEQLLDRIRALRAKIVVIDITGVPAVDTTVANHLVQTMDASRLMGATVIVTGLSSEIARTLVTIGVDLTKMKTVGDLQGGIEHAERLLGYSVAMRQSPPT